MSNYDINQLNLRGLNSTFKLLTEEADQYLVSTEDGGYTETAYQWKYYDWGNNNVIRFLYTSDNGLEENRDKYLLQIVNGIRDSAYWYLINTLNNNTGLIVEWSAIPYTTSDYKIIHPGADNEAVKSIHQVAYKYMEVTKDGLKLLKV